MYTTQIKNYSGIKARVQEELDIYNEDQIFFFNDKQTVMMLSHGIYKDVVALKDQNPCFCIRFYLSPWQTSGVISIIVADQAIERTAVVSYGLEMSKALYTPKEKQLELLQEHWTISSTRAMMRLVIQSIIDKADRSYDAETLQLLLENVDMLPAEGQYLAQPTSADRPLKEMVICWLVNRPEHEDTCRFGNSELIEVARIPEWSETRNHIIFETCMAVVLMIVKVNEAQTLNA
ncbi:MAG: hypothetical protein CMP20_15320 [Rickettsiales bacterium]|nr:hypothetical protein [Rickettsiales bacterium]